MSRFDRSTLTAKLARGLAALGLSVAAETQQQLLDYLALLHKWNRVHNLTAVRDPEAMVVRHLLDSLAVLPHIHAWRLLDVGSGAGLPGIPLALCLPDLRVTVLDSSHKKASFMRQVKAELELANLQVVCARVEQFRPEERYDIIIARAFSDLQQLINRTRHLLQPDGQWLAMKGVIPQAELEQLAIQPTRILPLQVPELDAQRHLIFLPFDTPVVSSEVV